MGSSQKQGLLAFPGIGVSLLPKLMCPACWPAYAAVLSSVGLGFLISTTYLLPLTALFFNRRYRFAWIPRVQPPRTRTSLDGRRGGISYSPWKGLSVIDAR